MGSYEQLVFLPPGSSLCILSTDLHWSKALQRVASSSSSTCSYASSLNPMTQACSPNACPHRLCHSLRSLFTWAFSPSIMSVSCAHLHVCCALLSKFFETLPSHFTKSNFAADENRFGGALRNLKPTGFPHSSYIRVSGLGFMRQYLFIFFSFLGQHPQHVEDPRLGLQSELQLLAHTIATATPDPSCLCDLHHDAGPLTHKARPGIEPTSSWILVKLVTRWATRGTPTHQYLLKPLIFQGRAKADNPSDFLFHIKLAPLKP